MIINQCYRPRRHNHAIVFNSSETITSKLLCQDTRILHDVYHTHTVLCLLLSKTTAFYQSKSSIPSYVFKKPSNYWTQKR